MSLALSDSLDSLSQSPWAELGNYLDKDIANGDAASDTLVTYGAQLKQYFSWCMSKKIDPLLVDEEIVKDYRRYLVKKKYTPATISLKLTVVRRLYAAAVKRGLIATNPAVNIKPPRQRRDAAEQNNYLEEAEARQLIEVLPKDNSLVGLRDRLLVYLMVIQGCRQIELHRLNVGDVIRRGNQVGIRVSGKGSIRVVPLTLDVAKVLDRYLKIRRAEGEKLTKDIPMFISVSPNSAGSRLTRRSMQRIVNYYLEAAKLKHSENRTVTTHGLRHTVGYLLTAIGKPLRVIQEFLGHADPRTTAIYAHIFNLWENNPASSLNLS